MNPRLPILAANDRLEVKRRAIRAGFYLHGVFGAGTLGYYLLGEGDWSVVDCLYMTVITLTTVGYEEVLPIGTVPGARVFTLVLIVVGMGLVLYFVSSLTAFFVDGSLGHIFQRRRMQKRLANLSGHYIVCGIGKTGIHVIEELLQAGRECVALDSEAERAALVTERWGEQIPAVLGDATQDDDLLAVGVERAAGLVAALGEEVHNLYATISARQLNPKLRIIVTSDDQRAESKFKHAGADSVVYTSIIGGRRIASEMIRPEVVTFLDLILRDKERNLMIEEVAVPSGSKVIGMTLTDADLRRFGDILVIAVRDNQGDYTYNPGPTTELMAGDVLIMLGEAGCIRQARDFVH